MADVTAEVEVVALARGYFGHLRERGDRFSVPASMVGRWMRVVEAPAQADDLRGAPNDDEPQPAGQVVPEKRGRGRPRNPVSS